MVLKTTWQVSPQSDSAGGTVADIHLNPWRNANKRRRESNTAWAASGPKAEALSPGEFMGPSSSIAWGTTPFFFFVSSSLSGNNYKIQVLGTSVRNFLDQIIRSGKTHPRVGCTFLWQLRKAVEEERVFACLFVSLPGWWTLPGRFVNHVAATATFLYPTLQPSFEL